MANHKPEILAELQRRESEKKLRYKSVSKRDVAFFGSEYSFSCVSETERAIECFGKIKEEITKIQYIDCMDFSTGKYLRVLFSEHNVWKAVDNRIAEYVLNNDLTDIFDIDKEATDKRNDGLTGDYYRVGTYKKEVQEAIIAKCDEYIAQLTELRAEIETEARKKIAEEDEKRAEWTEIKVHKHISPKGGEMGVDGWHDATYRRGSDGAEVRIISKDIFDVGKYEVAYREKDDQSEETEAEKSCINWLIHYNPVFGRGIRM